MHELPAALFLGLLQGGRIVVLRDLLAQRAQQDHGDHDRQEEHDHEGVADGEPVHLLVRSVRRQISIPALRSQKRKGRRQ